MADDRTEKVDVEIPPQAPPEEQEPVQKVTSVPSGARRDGYFKERDYPDEDQQGGPES